MQWVVRCSFNDDKVPKVPFSDGCLLIMNEIHIRLSNSLSFFMKLYAAECRKLRLSFVLQFAAGKCAVRKLVFRGRKGDIGQMYLEINPFFTLTSTHNYFISIDLGEFTS